MQESYNPKDLEKRIQEKWYSDKDFKAKPNKDKKFYCLSMFPYPSGNLHIGHVRNYTISDVIARYHRMLGENVLHPIGWDAFGLPAENAAIENNLSPNDWTLKNIDNMKKQLKSLGFSYDWDREISTCSKDYYRWEQWFFIKLYEKDLVYKKESLVNWDPVDKTVLANEQVIDGKGWRSGADVEKKKISQWFLKTSLYASELLKDLEEISKLWPDNVISMQKNWIGESDGAEFSFCIENKSDIRIFTTRPDTIYGVTFLAVAADHEIIESCSKEVKEFSKKIINQKDYKDKSNKLICGIFTGYYAIHPLTNKKIPIWLSNYVLTGYGTGAVMGVPAHDQRDYDFAKEYGLEIIKVIENDEPDSSAYTGTGKLINSFEFNNFDNTSASNAIVKHISKVKKGSKKKNFKLRDWGISRQRYWGCPIPVIYREDGEILTLDEDELPIELPHDIDFTKGGNPLENHPTWKYTKCKKTGLKAIRETDTLDTFFESSWYQARFCSPKDEKNMIGKEADYWMPVDIYVGGIEHAVLHLLYARFFHKLLRDEGLLKTNEPFMSLVTQGMVLKDGSKMSKSKGNVIDPQDLIQKYGADTVRLFVIFAAPIENSLEWSENGVEGAHRFLNKLWLTGYHLINKKVEDINNDNNEEKNLKIATNKAILKVSDDYGKKLSLNTIVSTCMELLNNLNKNLQKNNVSKETLMGSYESIILLLNPITPHICQEISDVLNLQKFYKKVSWPEVDKNFLESDTALVIIQINGKVRKKIEVDIDTPQEEIEKIATDLDEIKKYIENKKIKKIIYIQNKLVNIVV